MPFVALQGRPQQSATIGYAITPNPVRPIIVLLLFHRNLHRILTYFGDNQRFVYGIRGCTILPSWAEATIIHLITVTTFT